MTSKADHIFDLLNDNISNAIRDPGFNRNRIGQSDDFGGHAFEEHIRYQPTPRINNFLINLIINNNDEQKI